MSYTERLDVNYAVAHYHWIYFFDYKKKMPVKNLNFSFNVAKNILLITHLP